MNTLRIGDPFPAIQASTVDGSTLRIPDELNGLNAVLLFYRGHW